MTKINRRSFMLSLFTAAATVACGPSKWWHDWEKQRDIEREALGYTPSRGGIDYDPGVYIYFSPQSQYASDMATVRREIAQSMAMPQRVLVLPSSSYPMTYERTHGAHSNSHSHAR